MVHELEVVSKSLAPVYKEIHQLQPPGPVLGIIRKFWYTLGASLHLSYMKCWVATWNRQRTRFQSSITYSFLPVLMVYHRSDWKYIWSEAMERDGTAISITQEVKWLEDVSVCESTEEHKMAVCSWFRMNTVTISSYLHFLVNSVFILPMPRKRRQIIGCSNSWLLLSLLALVKSLGPFHSVTSRLISLLF